MKKMSVLVVLALIATALAALPVAAQQNVPPLCSGVQLQNTNATTPAAVVIDFYKQGENDGTSNYMYTVSPDLAANGSKSFYLPNVLPSTVPDGMYSAIVSSSQPLNALVNELSCAGSALVGASHHGMQSSEVGTTVYLPYVLSRAFTGQNWSSAIAIQNSGAAATTNLKIEFFAPGSATAKETFTFTASGGLKAGETWYLDLSQGQYATANLNPFAGVAKVTSDQPMAVVVNYAKGDGTRLLSYNGVTDGDTTLYAPQFVKHAFGAPNWTSGLTVYNFNGTDTPVTIDFIPSGSSTAVFSYNTTVAANNVAILYAGSAWANPLPDGFNGTAVVKVTSGTNHVVGIANMDSSAGMADALNLARKLDAATTLYLPQIVRNYGGIQSGWQVVNTSANALTLSIEYWKVDPAGNVTLTLTDSKPLPGNSALTNYVGGMTVLGDNWNGGVIVKVSGAGSIVGQGNFVVPGNGDGLLLYNAFK